jgi:1-acyl-sn-glycerol-3-phosphate acyltransferase
MTVQARMSEALGRAGGSVQEWVREVDIEQAVEKLWYWSGRSVIDMYARLALHLDVVWHAALPTGPKIIAVNHPTTTDPFYMLAVIPEQMSLLITDMAFGVPGFGDYLRAAGHVPVVEGNGRLAFEQAKELLQTGQTIGIFVEGALSPLGDGLGFHQARTGAVRLALSTGAPIVPVGISLDPRHIRFQETTVGERTEIARWYLGGPYAVTVGRAMVCRGNVEDREWVRTASQRVLQRIESLSRASAWRLESARLERNTGLASFRRQGMADETM